MFGIVLDTCMTLYSIYIFSIKSVEKRGFKGQQHM